MAHLAYDIALENHLERPYRLYIAGMLHDVAKAVEAEVASLLMEKFFPQYVDMKKWTYHQFLGRMMAETFYGVKDQEILNAIACHCTAKSDMGPLDMILYASDKIEPGRGYDSSEFIKACKKDYRQGFITVLKANQEFYQSKGWEFGDNQMTEACLKQYLGEDK